MEKRVSARMFVSMRLQTVIILQGRAVIETPYKESLEDLYDMLGKYLVKWLGEGYLRRVFKERENPFTVDQSEVRDALTVISAAFNRCDELIWKGTPERTPEYPIHIVEAHEGIRADIEHCRKQLSKLEDGTP